MECIRRCFVPTSRGHGPKIVVNLVLPGPASRPSYEEPDLL
jgi:hypothetical protein